MKLDREIEQLLAVEPSPEFVARVRARVAAEPSPAASWLSWRLLPAGIGTAAVAVAATVWLSGPFATVADEEPRVAPGVEAAAAALDVGRLKAAPTSASETRVLPPAPSPAAAAGPERAAVRVPTPPDAAAEILISPDDARAFRLLLARVGEGMLLEVPPAAPDDAVVGPPWIEIAPVVIQPLAQLAQDEGGRQ